MSKKARQSQKQAGAVSLLISCVLGAIAIMILSFSGLAAKQAVLSYDTQLNANLDLAIQELQTWYEKNADTIAASSTDVSEAQLLAVLSKQNAGMRAVMSTSMASGNCQSAVTGFTCIPWRKIAVWYPASTPVGTPLVQDGIPVGEFSGDALWRVYSSQSWYSDRFSRQTKKIDDVGRALMAWFEGQSNLNPDDGPAVNYWRASNCAVQSHGIPCVDSYTDISTTAVQNLIGMSSAELSPVIGKSIDFSNLQDSSQTPPYSVSLRVQMPWGQYMKRSVVQP